MSMTCSTAELHQCTYPTYRSTAFCAEHAFPQRERRAFSALRRMLLPVMLFLTYGMIRGGVVRLATHTDDEQSGVGADSYVMSYIWEMFQFPLRRCEHLDYAASGGRMIRE